MIDEQKVIRSIDRFVENEGQPIVMVRQPSKNLEDAALNPEYDPPSLLQPFIMNPAKKLVGVFRLLGWADMANAKLDINLFENLTIATALAYNYTKGVEYDKLTFWNKLCYKYSSRVLKGNLNRLYNYLQDDSLQGSFKSYLSIYYLNILKGRGISLDPLIVMQLERTRNYLQSTGFN